MKKITLCSVVFAGLAIVAFVGCDLSNNSPTSGTPGGAPIDTLQFIGSPVLDSNRLYLALLGADTNNNVIQFSQSQVTFTIDSVKSTFGTAGHYTAQTLTTNNVVPINGRPLAAQLIFDGSGSMASSDPLGQRKIAGRSFIKIAGAVTGSKVAIAEFGVGSDSLYYYNLRADYTLATDTTILFKAIDSLDEDGSTPFFTSVRRGLEHADSVISGSQYARTIVAFTDGQENDSYYPDSIEAIISLSKLKQIPVSTIGLGTGVDQAVLQHLALSTGGVYSLADSANALAAVYAAMGTAISTGYTQVTGQLNGIPTVFETLYITVTVTSGGTSQSKQFVVKLLSAMYKRSISKVG